MAERLSFVDTVTGGSSNGTSSVPFSVEDPMALPPLDPDAGFFTKVGHYYTRYKLYKDEKFRTLRPWGEFVDRTQFSVPSKYEALGRISRNYSYFHSNYVVVVAAMSVYILITNAVFMLAMMMCGAMYYWFRLKADAKEPIVVFGREYTPTQAYAGLVISTLLLFYLTNGSSTVFWLVTWALILVLGHAATRQPIDDHESSPFQLV
jgi:hypothetical protein